MIITRTPLRISIGGGGTDLPSFYRRRGGACVSAAINKYIFIALNRRFTDGYAIRYSKVEHVATADEIQHPIVREVFTRHGVGPGIEMVSIADIPAGTGLGSSGAFAVGLLRAVHSLNREHVTATMLAEEAAHIEIEVLGEPVGKQDQYIAAFGGLSCFEFGADGRVAASPLAVSQETLHNLEERLLLFFTGYMRSASSVLADQHERTEEGDDTMLAKLDETKALGERIRAALESGHPDEFGELMHEHWVRKRERSQGISSPEIDGWYELGRANGARGGKLVGAGTGGFLMFYADDPKRLRSAMADAGLAEQRFQFDLEGSAVVLRDWS
jgi:D-glycero-alpha-D-manno-heptose-7-phosphate kinase